MIDDEIRRVLVQTAAKADHEAIDVSKAYVQGRRTRRLRALLPPSAAVAVVGLAAVALAHVGGDTAIMPSDRAGAAQAAPRVAPAPAETVSPEELDKYSCYEPNGCIFDASGRSAPAPANPPRFPCGTTVDQTKASAFWQSGETRLQVTGARLASNRAASGGSADTVDLTLTFTADHDVDLEWPDRNDPGSVNAVQVAVIDGGKVIATNLSDASAWSTAEEHLRAGVPVSISVQLTGCKGFDSRQAATESLRAFGAIRLRESDFNPGPAGGAALATFTFDTPAASQG